jgi:hypothetical protein
MSASHAISSQLELKLPLILVQNINHTQDAATSKTSQKKNASQLQKFLSFCAGLRISKNNAPPAREDILLAWASSFAGCLAGKMVSMKLLAVRKEHE